MWTNAQYQKNYFSGEVAAISAEKDGWHHCIMIDEENVDYREIMQLVAEGKLTIAPASDE